MILYLCRAMHAYTMRKFLASVPLETRNQLRILTYESLFARGQLPPAHLIFADLDRLSQMELELAADLAARMRAAVPGVNILNDPARFWLRAELLENLWRSGDNPFRALRADLPLPDDLRWPVFVRREAGCGGPETALLPDHEALMAQIEAMRARGLPMRGRLVVEYCAVPDAAGMFAKYAAFRVGDLILPQHIQFSENWVVKGNSRRITPQNVAAEMAYIHDNPHQDELRRLLDRAGAQFGRVDYTLIDGRICIYEMNSNPTFPSGNRPDLRQERREIVRARLCAAFAALDTPMPRHPSIRLLLPQMPDHNLPGWRPALALWWRRTRAALQGSGRSRGATDPADQAEP